MANLRLVIEDEDERYPKVDWEEGLSGEKFKGEIAWDGRFKDGTPATPGGEYYAWIKVTDSAGNEIMQAGQIIVEAAIPLSDDPPGKLITSVDGSEPIDLPVSPPSDFRTQLLLSHQQLVVLLRTFWRGKHRASNPQVPNQGAQTSMQAGHPILQSQTPNPTYSGAQPQLRQLGHLPLR